MPPFPLALGLSTLERGGIAAFLLDVSRRMEDFVCKIRDWGPLKIQNYSLITIIIFNVPSSFKFFQTCVTQEGGGEKQANCFKED